MSEPDVRYGSGHQRDLQQSFTIRLNAREIEQMRLSLICENGKDPVRVLGVRHVCVCVGIWLHYKQNVIPISLSLSLPALALAMAAMIVCSLRLPIPTCVYER